MNPGYNYFMNKFQLILDYFLGFLFPQSLEVESLEKMSPEKILKIFPSPRPIKDSKIIALFDYQDRSVRAMIRELKYKGNPKIVRSLAIILIDVLQNELSDRAFFEGFKDPILIPVPISKERRLERGYNQIELILEEVKKLDTNNDFVYEPTVLQKIRHTESQTKTHSKRARLENLKNSMIVKETTDLRGKSVFLIDDVYTTGATSIEAMRAMKARGAKKILCICLSH